jgi:two-component system heavy metal sensor histidine kinase CusS
VEALNAMLDRLDQAFERLSRFSADLAHELRTPINNLMGEAEVALSKERPTEEYRQVLESSMDEFRRLSRLISRMLFLARAEGPHMTLQKAPIDANRLVSNVLAFFEAAGEEQGVRLTGEGVGIIQGDSELLRQALANLISNALEATRRGGEIRVQAGEMEGRTALSVVDTGRGIEAGELPRILDRFYRTKAALEQKHPGTGLGLAIVQSIARLHGGILSISSEPGKGTVARLEFPL